jgi:Flp pilus assembly pilin Flp
MSGQLVAVAADGLWNKEGVAMRRAEENTVMPLAHKTIVALQAAGDAATASEKRDRGVAMAEYALLLAFVFLVALLTIKTFGDTLVDVFDRSETVFTEAPSMNREG